MLILMPWIVKHFGIPDLVGGAWIGGTIDTSGAVSAVVARLSLGELAERVRERSGAQPMYHI